MGIVRGHLSDARDLVGTTAALLGDSGRDIAKDGAEVEGVGLDVIGNFTLADTLIPGDTPYGAHGGDIDEDGDLDLCIPNENTSDVSVFLNDGNANFSGPFNYPVGFHCSPSEATDLDHDGKRGAVLEALRQWCALPR